MCLEAGLTRSKNNINVAIKNLADLGFSILCFWVIGYGLMFGRSTLGLIGLDHFALDIGSLPPITGVTFLYQAMFCGTAVTIISGAIAERVKFSSYLLISVFISVIVYPTFGHWAWNITETGIPLGWLGARGFIDFAGATVVHSTGGWAALAILIIIGPRYGRFAESRSSKPFTGSNLPLATLGVIILWFGWFGFNGGSTFAFNDQAIPVLANTMIAGSAGLVSALVVGSRFRKHADIDLVLNGSLAGLVAITANAHIVSTPAAVIIGLIAGIVMLAVNAGLEKYHIDDAVGAIPVHLGGGIWGTLAVALFAQPHPSVAGHSFLALLGIQATGIIVCGMWVFGLTYLFARITNHFSPLRVSSEDEQIGLNVSEHGATTDLLDLFQVMDTQAQTGDLGLRVPVEPFTEAGQIAARYNDVMNSLETTVAKTDAIINTTQDGIITLSNTNPVVIQTLNPAAQTMFGYETDQLISQPLSMLLPSLNQAALGNGYRTDGGLNLNFGLYQEDLGKRNDGSCFPIEFVITKAWMDEAHFLVGTFRDITQRKQAEKALKESETRFREVVTSISDHVYMTEISASGESNNRYLSPNVEALTGYSVDQLLSDWAFWSTKIIHPEDRDIAVSLKDHYLKGVDKESEYRIIHQNGHTIWVRDSARVEKDATSHITRVFGVISDITSWKHTQETLQIAHDQIMQASQLKSELMARVSHELRTPLNAVLGFSEMLQLGVYGDVSVEQSEVLEDVVQSGRDLEHLIDQVINHTLLEANKLALSTTTFNLSSFIQKVCGTHNPNIEAKGLAFTANIAPDLPTTITTDEARLEQVLNILLSNAIKFTSEGSISVQVDQDKGGKWFIRVSDTGRGISEADQKFIFEPFRQVDGSSTRTVDGAGLGLTVANQLVSLMGGHIRLQSQVGQGSCFTILLPTTLISEAQHG
ncbi:MAG: ammonium transporter [Chloroflexota bacterium]